MNYTVQELALQYAEKLTAYHKATEKSTAYNKAVQSSLSDNERDVRAARDEMYDAQNALNAACASAAELA